MTYAIVLLEDETDFGKVTAHDISHWDRDAEIIRVRTIIEAKQVLEKRSDVAFVIVDLYLLLEENGEQVLDFVKWLFTEQQFSEMFVIATSRYNRQIQKLKIKVIEQLERRKRERISIVKRTSDYDNWRYTLLQRIEEAHRRYGGT